ncbi:hypothetical protein K491DRAFT_782064 [Lophiostoma macrostomum CBS 122681]|uniref:Uncharacterized protein n=1 Tax=Lophiostoma macrostomum CBS 122681 TaxID=1314788 RepID=A0A6A6SXJ8_9PLEO|nr:hypothetical protein K491DRAFT_782064 [Lophiostoma macrostomum CBS 122681]
MAVLLPTPPANLPYTTLQRRSTTLPQSATSVVFLSLFTLFVLFTLFTTINALFVRRLSPRRYLLTTINPLILCFTWPYHLYVYLQHRRNMKAIKRLADDEAGGFVSQEMVPTPANRIAAPQAHPPLSQPLDLGLRNQIPLRVSSMREGGRDFITVTEGKAPSPTGSRPTSLCPPSGGHYNPAPYTSPYAEDDVAVGDKPTYLAGPRRMSSVRNDRESGYVYNSADGWRDSMELETGLGMEAVGLTPPVSAKEIV